VRDERRYTFVCTRCHAGWEVTGKAGIIPPRPRCNTCGQSATLRGVYHVIELRAKRGT